MNKTCKFLCRLLPGLFALALFLAACGPGQVTGLDAVAQTGQWMSVVEPVQDASPQLTVVDIYTGKPQLTLTDAIIYQHPITIYSPSGEYLLYRGVEMWQLVEIFSQRWSAVAPIRMNLEFLRDDEILIINEQEVASPDGSQSQRVYQIWLASPQSPEQANWREITNHGQYIFKNQAQGLSGVSGSASAKNTPAQAFCPPSPVVAWDTRVIVDIDRTALVLTSNSYESTVRRPRQLSTATTDLLHTHETVREALALKQIQENPEYANLTDAEKAAMIDAIAHSGITGLASPDGKRLLILTVTSIDADTHKYSLNLIDLETDKRIRLSSESEWTPAFLFSPDGGQIVYESNNEGDRAWYLSSSDGSHAVRLPLQDIGALCWH